MSKILFSMVSAGAVLTGLGASAATLGTSATAYSLGNGGTSLVTLATKDDAAPSSTALSFAGGSSTTLDAIAYRPQTGQLYGYDNAGGTVYEIDVMSGVASFSATNTMVTSTDSLGFDFNNQLDAARIVTANEENVVFFPNNMPANLARFTDLEYVVGDAMTAADTNAGADPNVVMNAYTNAVPDASSTFQYVIDTDLDILGSLGNNAGTLKTVGQLTMGGIPFDVAEEGGFDILSFSEGNNTAFALLTDQNGGQGIYTFGLDADLMGNVEVSLVTGAPVPTEFGPLTGFAVAPAPIPLPAAGFMLLAGLGGLGALRRRAKG